jgi:hypothetical protein
VLTSPMVAAVKFNYSDLWEAVIALALFIVFVELSLDISCGVQAIRKDIRRADRLGMAGSAPLWAATAQ